MNLQITNIQRFSLYDGPGIRTTIFLKGCSLKCPWCCNPENIDEIPEFYFKSKNCINCKQCSKICDEKLILEPEDVFKIKKSQIFQCLRCKKCIYNCPTNSLGIYGTEMDDEDILDIINKDNCFYSFHNGGVTFSGGEPLFHASKILNILIKLKKEGIHTAIETSLFVPIENLKLIENMIDLFIIDIKILDESLCNRTIEGDLKQFENNFKEILSRNKSFIIRFPLVNSLTFNKNNLNLLFKFIEEYNIKYLEIFKIHTLARDKYKNLNLKPRKFGEITEEEVNILKEDLTHKLGVKVNILDI